MNAIAQDLLVNVVGTLVGAVILWLLARLSRRGAPTIPAENIATDSTLTRLGSGWILAASLGFAVLALGVDVFQPPPPLPAMLGTGGYRPADFQYLMFEAERLRSQVRNEMSNQIRNAEADAEAIILRAADEDAALRAKGQTEAAQAVLRLAERRAALVIETAQEDARHVLQATDTTARELQSRATTTFGSIGEALGVLLAALARAMGTFLRTLILALFLSSITARWSLPSLGWAEIRATLIVALIASALTVLGFAIAAELLVPPVLATVVYAASFANASPGAALVVGLRALRDRFGFALSLCGTVIALAVIGWYVGDGIDDATQYLARVRGLPIVMIYGANLPTAMIAFELGRAAAGILFLQHLILRAAANRPPALAPSV